MAELVCRSKVTPPCVRSSVRTHHPSLAFRSSSASPTPTRGRRSCAGHYGMTVAAPTTNPPPATKRLRPPNALLQWWEKGRKPNMKEVSSAQELVDSLRNAGDQLVIVDFFSPGCGGCRTLHPKLSQIAEANPALVFIQVNHEEQKSMCYTLGVNVLPFFRFYRGARGRLCSFSCTIATIKKFKDALAKHGLDNESSLGQGPAKGLEESELQALAAKRDLNFTHPVISDVCAQGKMVGPPVTMQWDPSLAPPLITDLLCPGR